jgi:hypothetical protein
LLLLQFFFVSSLIPCYGYKHGDEFQSRIPSLDSKPGIEQPIFISRQ